MAMTYSNELGLKPNGDDLFQRVGLDCGVFRPKKWTLETEGKGDLIQGFKRKCKPMQSW